MPDNILPFTKDLSAPEAQKLVRELVKKGRISWSRHAKQRMDERKVTIPQVINCLSKGRITETPFYSHRNGGGFETRIEKGTAGEWLRVVICIRLSKRVLVVSVID